MVVASVMLLVAAASAQAFTTVNAPFGAAVDLAKGFPTCSQGGAPLGPVGFADDGKNTFVLDICNRTTYRFGPDGGDPATAPQFTSGLNHSLIFHKGGYYGTDADGGGTGTKGVWTWDPNTLHLGHLVAAIPGARIIRGAFGDPATTDLYVSSLSGIWRVQGPESASPTVSNFVSGGNIDGMGFKGDGTILYAADLGTGHVRGWSVPSGTQVFDLDVGGGGLDGITVAPPNRVINGVDISDNVFVNFNDGTVKRIDVHNGNAITTVASGGTRGDFAFVDSQGFLVVSQTDSFVRLKPNVFATSAPVNTAPPAVGNGTAVEGQPVICSPGAWSGGPTFAFAWNRDGAPIAGATTDTYTPRAADVGHKLTCTVTGSNPAGSGSVTSAAVTVKKAPTGPVMPPPPPGGGTQTGGGSQSGTTSGPQGPQGGGGPAGPPGAAGKIIELVTCKTAKKPKHSKKKPKQKCTTKLVSGPVTFTRTSTIRATLTRAGVIKAVGTASRSRGQISLQLSTPRPIAAGAYVLTLTAHHKTTRTRVILR